MANDLNVSIGAEIGGLQKGLDAASRELTKFEGKVKNLANVGTQMQSIGKAMSIGITTPLIAIGGLAAKAFSEIEGVRNAFERLDSPDLLKNLRQATNNTVSDMELMKNAVQANNFKIPMDEMAGLLEFASRRAKDTGESVDYLVSSIVTGIGRKSPLILDNLGISAIELKENLNGVSLEAASIGQITEAVGKVARKELEKMGADTLTLGDQWLQLKTVIQNAMVDIGAIIAPMLKPVISIVKDLAEKFKNLSPEIKKVVVVVGIAAAALGPLLAIGGTLLTLLPALSAGAAALGTAFTIMTGPIGLVVVALGAVVYAVTKNWDKIKPYIIGTINYFIQLYNESITLRIGVEALAFAFKTSFSVIKNVLSTAWELIKSFTKAAADSFAGLGTILKGVWDGDLEAIKKGAKQVGSAYLTGFVDISNDIKTGINNITNDVKENYNKALENLSGGKKDLITELFGSNIEEKVKDKVKDLGDGLRRPILVPLNLQFEGIDEGFTKLNEKITTGLQSASLNYLTQAETFKSKSDIVGQEISAGLSESLSIGLSNGIASAFEAMGGALASGSNVLSAVGSSLLSSLGGLLVDVGRMAITVGIGILGIKKSLETLNPFVAIAAGAALVALGSFFSSKSKSIGGSMGGGGGSSSTGSAGGSSYSAPTASAGGGGFNGGTVVFEISGQKLVGVLSNTLDRNKRSGGNLSFS